MRCHEVSPMHEFVDLKLSGCATLLSGRLQRVLRSFQELPRNWQCQPSKNHAQVRGTCLGRCSVAQGLLPQLG